VLLVGHESPSLGLVRYFRLSFNLIDQHTVLVDYWTQDQVIGSLLDQFVSECRCLIESGRGSHTEDRFPSALSRHAVIELVREP